MNFQKIFMIVAAVMVSGYSAIPHSEEARDQKAGDLDVEKWNLLYGNQNIQCGSRAPGFSPSISRLDVENIKKGSDAKAGAWPWQVGIRQYKTLYCGGVLIGAQWVLTAAHCLRDKMEVVVGRTSLNTEPTFVIPANITIGHPGYNFYYKENDIALLRLQAPVQFDDYIRPACFHGLRNSVIDQSKCYISGWGYYNEERDIPSTLQQLKVTFMSNESCSALARERNIKITDTVICLDVAETGAGSCSGDSGGPLSCEINGVYFVAGITSFGNCTKSVLFDVYTRVSYYEDWISSIINETEENSRHVKVMQVLTSRRRQ